MQSVLSPALILFVALVLSVSLYGLTVSGHFPREHRSEGLRDTTGAAVLWVTMAICAAAAVFAIGFAIRHLPWHLAVIGGGGALLAAPPLLQPFPDSFVNGRRGLITFAATSIVLAGCAWQLGG